MVDGEEKGERTWRLTAKSYTISTTVTAPIYDAILRILESGSYINIPDYLRDLIRENLKARGIKLEAGR